MKALLIKDFYTLTRQMKVYLLMILIFACVPGNSMSTFAIFYAAMIPVSALAYDERSKWGRMAAMMPYSKKTLVFSKYLLGYCVIGVAALITVAAQTVLCLTKQIPFGWDGTIEVGSKLCISLLALCLTLPFMFRLGVEKGRFTFFIIIAIIVFASVSGGGLIAGYLEIAKSISIAAVMGILVFVTLAVNVISIVISCKVYTVK